MKEYEITLAAPATQFKRVKLEAASHGDAWDKARAIERECNTGFWDADECMRDVEASVYVVDVTKISP